MTALRFAIAAVPCLFVRQPERVLAGADRDQRHAVSRPVPGAVLGIAHGVPVGLASVIVQSQALFTVAFAALAFREFPTRMQIAGIAVAAIGLLMICGTVGFDFSVGAFAVLMISPVSFAIGNLLLRQARDVPMFDLFAWLCLVPPLPLLALALVIDGPQATWHSLTHMSLTGLVCMLFLGVSRPASPTGCGAGCCAITPRRRWCRSRCWCRSSAPPHPASFSAKRFGPLRLAGWSRWSAASR